MSRRYLCWWLLTNQKTRKDPFLNFYLIRNFLRSIFLSLKEKARRRIKNWATEAPNMKRTTDPGSRIHQIDSQKPVEVSNPPLIQAAISGDIYLIWKKLLGMIWFAMMSTRYRGSDSGKIVRKTWIAWDESQALGSSVDRLMEERIEGLRWGQSWGFFL